MESSGLAKDGDDFKLEAADLTVASSRQSVKSSLHDEVFDDGVEDDDDDDESAASLKE